jgi:putative ubiquitin-RnfH superfamily antitoxin RatB of RatAB toxin-antitoxin module
MENKKIEVEVVYAEQEKQVMLKLQVEEGCTVENAIHQSGILQKFPEINLDQNKVGVFSKQVSLDTILSPQDRVEIYRPLLIDPKQARKQRAKAAMKKQPL